MWDKQVLYIPLLTSRPGGGLQDKEAKVEGFKQKITRGASAMHGIKKIKKHPNRLKKTTMIKSRTYKIIRIWALIQKY